VLKNFDPVAAQKDGQSVVIQELTNIHVDQDLVIELVPAVPSDNPAQLPILNALEVIRGKEKD
jgi:hypothetical protein